MLEKFAEAKAEEIASLKVLAASGAFPEPLIVQRPQFKAGLLQPGPQVIAEYKRASPSKGDINLAASPAETAEAYAKAGAAALSVLTEEVYFKGKLEFLAQMTGPGLPLLRKDFILHPLQVRATLATPASAILLIVRMVTDAELRNLYEVCTENGLEAVVEVFDQVDLDRAQMISPEIIQVNNRDLDTLQTDLAVSERLIAGKQDGQAFICASGISRPDEVTRLHELGFDAFLVGTSLMSGADPGQALATLTGRNT
ncbi:indole-3-glycerol-phosphate synthase [Desulfovibrio inopinatus]|uniref:indole-3-glycerol-phosphate synthase n=1 Tax=Desulfovibrio inopinatus TaxID=102109 RepID=UPI00041E8763|nr:indole-3-glycerol-phosphate synthase [Desulfovibrio inopinatus]